jgi:hypothetical protein
MSQKVWFAALVARRCFCLRRTTVLAEQAFDFPGKNVDRIGRHFLTNSFRGFLSHVSEVFSPSPKDLERLPHAGNRWGRGENTRNPIFDYFRISADVGSHHRPRTQHCFDYR